MTPNRYAAALVVSLFILPAALISYRVLSLNYPLFPALPERAWQLSLNARVADSGRDATVKIALPSSRQGVTVLEEKITDGALDFSLRSEGRNRFGIWSGTPDAGGTPISYSASIIVRTGFTATTPPKTPEPYPEGIGKEEQALAERLTAKFRLLPVAARIQAVAAAAAGNWGQSVRPAADLKNWPEVQNRLGIAKSMLALLKAADINARAVEGLRLEESLESETITLIEVWTGLEWQVINPESGNMKRKPVAFLPLASDAVPVIRSAGGEVSDLRWDLKRQIIGQWDIQYERFRQSDRFLDRWSLFRLPPEFQNTFRILILVPLGALIVCLLRNVIGLPTFGIFMPVLMALAFRNTGLLPGLGIFAAVLLIGYIVRRFMDRLRLLLVPRLSVILTLVIGCFVIFAMAGNKLGLREFMAIGLLPFVILTLTIERFHIIIEEQGTREAFRTAAGSAAVATMTFAIIQFEPLQITFFVYPELLLIVMAAQALLGRYTGYRLTELLRFRQLKADHDN
jgi:hypothetical protein